MIIVRSPLRISLGGGGTDLASYYRDHEGFLIAGAIDKYVYVTLTRPFTPGIYLKYSKLEHVETLDEVQHPIIREAIRHVGFPRMQHEITTLADIPAGTGLGSSSSFTTALLKALHAQKNQHIHPRELAEEACHIEIGVLNEPIGKQDQYAASFGGLTCYTFRRDGSVVAEPLRISEDTHHRLEDNLMLFFTGYSRSASAVLKEQNDKSNAQDADMLANLHFVKQLGYDSKAALESGDLIRFGELMDIHWQHKKKRSGKMSNPKIDEWYELAMRSGAVGGKLIGAGGGGFLMFYARDRDRLRTALSEAGMEEVRFRFDFDGTKVLVNG